MNDFIYWSISLLLSNFAPFLPLFITPPTHFPHRGSSSLGFHPVSTTVMINPTHQVQFIHHSPIPWMSLISTFLTPLLKQVIPGCSCLISLCFLSIRWCTTYKQKSLSLSLPPSLFLRLTAFCFLIIPESCVYGTRGFSSHCENKQETQSGDHSKEKQPGK